MREFNFDRRWRRDTRHDALFNVRRRRIFLPILFCLNIALFPNGSTRIVTTFIGSISPLIAILSLLNNSTSRYDHALYWFQSSSSRTTLFGWSKKNKVISRGSCSFLSIFSSLLFFSFYFDHVSWKIYRKKRKEWSIAQTKNDSSYIRYFCFSGLISNSKPQ